MGQKTSLRLACPTGTQFNLEAVAANTKETLFDAGVIPDDAPFNTYCSSDNKPALDVCKNVLDKAALYHRILFEC